MLNHSKSQYVQGLIDINFSSDFTYIDNKGKILSNLFNIAKSDFDINEGPLQSNLLFHKSSIESIEFSNRRLIARFRNGVDHEVIINLFSQILNTFFDRNSDIKVTRTGWRSFIRYFMDSEKARNTLMGKLSPNPSMLIANADYVYTSKELNGDKATINIQPLNYNPDPKSPNTYYTIMFNTDIFSLQHSKIGETTEKLKTFQQYIQNDGILKKCFQSIFE